METILLIEDNTEILENLTEYLEMEGYKILVADNGKKGIELAGKFEPDLIICDILMPGMSGYKVLHSIRNTANTREIFFIFSTSVSEEVEKAKALRLGADDYLIKPFELEFLLKMIKNRIGAGKARQYVKLKKIIPSSFRLPTIFPGNLPYSMPDF